MKYVIVGLGNPGTEYEHSPHNAGRMAVEKYVAVLGEEWKEHKASNSLVVKGYFGTAILPNTFMNKSGNAVMKFVKSVKAAERLIVVYDDIDLSIGSIKISFSRGSGGHKGIESIARSIKTKDFVRVRIGVSPKTAKGKVKKPQGEEAVHTFLLKSFKKPMLEELKKVFKTTNAAIDMIIDEGRQKAMNEFN